MNTTDILSLQSPLFLETCGIVVFPLPRAQVFIPFRAILHDAHTYPDPDAFKPTRYLTPDGLLDQKAPDPVEAFGYGRRICPGRYFAHDSLFLAMANILAAFTIESPLDELGSIIKPRADFASGFTRYV